MELYLKKKNVKQEFFNFIIKELNKKSFFSIKSSCLIICGPTASGKTSSAIKLAEEINGDIINIDAIQAFDSVKIGTAYPSNEEIALAPHHLFGFLKPFDRISSFEYVNLVEDKIQEVLNKNRIPILVGGSFFYIYSLLFSLRDETSQDEKNRLKVFFEKNNCNNLSLQEKYNTLSFLDPIYANIISLHDSYRIDRAFDILKGGSLVSSRKEIHKLKFNYSIAYIDTDRDYLYKNIDIRAKNMFKEGIVEEFLKRDSREQDWIAKKILGYDIIKKIAESFNEISEKEINFYIDEFCKKARHYAKHQCCFSKKLKKSILSSGLIEWIEFKNLKNL
jgi:tRNA dimethylallyltransferase